MEFFSSFHTIIGCCNVHAYCVCCSTMLKHCYVPAIQHVGNHACWTGSVYSRRTQEKQQCGNSLTSHLNTLPPRFFFFFFFLLQLAREGSLQPFSHVSTSPMWQQNMFSVHLGSRVPHPHTHRLKLTHANAHCFITIVHTHALRQQQRQTHASMSHLEAVISRKIPFGRAAASVDHR